MSPFFYNMGMKAKNNFPKKELKKKEKKKCDDSKLTGFATLNQVSGVPKSHPYKSKLQVSPAKIIKEPLVSCSICGETIHNISQAMINPDGSFVHFDCVLEDLKKNHSVHENQTISYIGRGTFALLEKDENGSWSIVERYVYENQESFEKMKAYVEGTKV